MEHFRGSLKNSGRVKILLISMATAFFILWSASDAYSHKVHVFAWVEGDTIHTQGYFSGGRKTQNSLIEVFDKDGNKLLDGRTNEKGEYSFKIPQKTDLKIVLTASMGHKNDFVITASEIEEVAVTSFLSKMDPRSADKTPSGDFKGEEQKGPAPATGAAALTADEINSIVEKALDKKLRPFIKLIAESKRHRPSITEVVGGIGYIFGIMGVFLYFKSRKKRR